jgi:hypothetical protein
VIAAEVRRHQLTFGIVFRGRFGAVLGFTLKPVPLDHDYRKGIRPELVMDGKPTRAPYPSGVPSVSHQRYCSNSVGLP